VRARARARSFHFSKHPRRADSFSRKAVRLISLVRLSIAVKWTSTIIFQLRGVVTILRDRWRTDSARFVRAFNSRTLIMFGNVTAFSITHQVL